MHFFSFPLARRTTRWAAEELHWTAAARLWAGGTMALIWRIAAEL
jgi:hypothetical protein